MELDGGEVLRADMVVVAAGRWTNKVAALAGAVVPTSTLLLSSGTLRSDTWR